MAETEREEQRGRKGGQIFAVETSPEGGFSVHFRPFPRLIPQETRTHLFAAQKEMLLAFRSILDAAIEGTEMAAKPRGRERTRIEVK